MKTKKKICVNNNKYHHDDRHLFSMHGNMIAMCKCDIIHFH